MKRVADLMCGLVLLVLSPAVVAAQTTPPCPDAPAYGHDAKAGRVVKVNGISLYYESYGNGPPLLLIHGNGGSIDSTRCQIAYFRGPTESSSLTVAHMDVLNQGEGA